jgi:hydrogenase maturation factor
MSGDRIGHLAPKKVFIYTRGVQVEPGLKTFNFTGIKRDASVAVLHAVVSGKCVILLIGGAHVAGQSRDLKMAVLMRAWNHHGRDRHRRTYGHL